MQAGVAEQEVALDDEKQLQQEESSQCLCALGVQTAVKVIIDQQISDPITHC